MWKEGILIKKILAIILSAAVIITVFTACSGNSADETDESSTHVTESHIPTQDAVIKESDAAKFIEESYSAKELGLEDVDSDYSFMVASSGVDIEGENYIKVVANIITKKNSTTPDGKETFSLETVGEYYISYDGETVLKKDIESGSYSNLENKYDQYKEKAEAEQSASETK